jgi:hypothetical protein
MADELNSDVKHAGFSTVLSLEKDEKIISSTEYRMVSSKKYFQSLSESRIDFSFINMDEHRY